LRIRRAESAVQIAEARALLEQYAASLGFDLAFQNFAEELAGLPGEYAPPTGALLLAIEGVNAAGCVALRCITGEVCEMKRLFVRPEFQGRGMGRALVLAIIAEGGRIGYERMRLDTAPSMQAAHALYVSLGFYEIAPYRFNPVPGTRFLELQLRPAV